MQKKTTRKFSTLMVGAAFAGLMAATATLPACSGGDSAAAERNGCNGPNGCGQNGAHKGEQNGCNGHNGCKGQETKTDAKAKGS